MERRTTWSNVGYYGFIYVLILLLLLAGYPVLQKYGGPLSALLTVEGEREVSLHILAAVSGMYWGVIGIYALASQAMKDR